MFKQVLLGFTALAFGGSTAIAASQMHVMASPSAKSAGPASEASLAPGLYGIIADFGAQPPPSGGWPCSAGSADCGGIAPGGLVIGAPNFTWALSACDAKTTADTGTCTQVFWSYADSTNDNTDDLVISVVVTQGKSDILQFSQDLGPNPFGDSVVYVYGDVAFGTIGNRTGPGNGWCETVTCVNPRTGLAEVVITTTVGTYSATQRFQISFE